MKNLKIGVLAFAALGLISIFMEFEGFKFLLKHDTVNGVILLAGFVVPLVMAIMGLTKPPFLAWQAAVSLAGFALLAVKTRIWQSIKHIGDVPTSSKLAMIAIIGGVIVSALAIAKPEDKA